MKKVLALLLVTSTLVAHAQVNDPRVAALEPQLDKLLADFKAVGFAVAVVEKNKLIYSKGFGYRDLANRLPVTPNTLFAIGSCTKAFTSSLIGMLDAEKKVELDKPARIYLPGLNFFNDALNDRVTLRDMMSHRTGLPRHDFSWYLFTSSSRDTLMQRIQYMEPSAGVRDRWQYNNFMFLLQGMVAEKATNKSWEENIREKIFRPLNMTRSNFAVADMSKDKDAAAGYYVKNDSVIKTMPYYNIDAMGPAGSINSSVNEMANWVITWINSGKFNGKEVLPDAYRTKAISSQMVIAPALPEKEVPDVFFANYGFGWFLSSYRGHYRVEHGGNIDGFSASTTFYPTDSIGIIVLSNQNGSAVPGLVRNIISDRLLQLKTIDWVGRGKKNIEKMKATEAESKKAMTSQQKQGTHPSHPLKDYEGVYTHPGYGSMEIYNRGDSLIAKTTNKVIWLKHYHYDVFVPYENDPEEGIDTAAGMNDFKFQFMMNMAGDIQSFQVAFEPSVKPLEFTKKPKEVQLSSNTLERYVGEYELAGVTVKVYTKGNTLYVFVPGQPEYELAATGENKFVFKSLNGFSLEFHLDGNNAVAALSFIQPNGTFKATKK